ncbi:NAD(P)-binding protein, partial [Exidia glandulosa HHB12029]
TGSNGFLGSWLCKILLTDGYRVVGTVRHIWQGEQLNDLFEDEFPQQFSYAIVEDIAQPHALDTHLEGVHAIIHCAVPVIFPDDPDDVLIPAIQGTRGVLDSAYNHGKSLRRVITTSSVLAMQEPRDLRMFFDEDDWNERSIRIVREQGRLAPGIEKYCAAKTLAEQAVWHFAAEHRHDLVFDISVVLPTNMCGPSLQAAFVPGQLNHSNRRFLQAILAIRQTQRDPTRQRYKGYMSSIVDVRDSAEIHVRALRSNAASGQRIIVSAGPVTVQDFG